METLKFKSNIKCGGCIATVTPFLNEVKGIEKWEVDVQNPQKILIVQSNGVSEKEIVAVVKKASYVAERVN
jgi:copper chaperone